MKGESNRGIFGKASSFCFSSLPVIPKKGNLSGSLFTNVLYRLFLNRIDDGFESLGIVHGQIGKDLAVDLDIPGV